ncbi:unnamed protein product [Urochloa decumbens]|uniref:Glycosyl transferase CAP10 domain-containing protein n=1 Tax=Urochloa decumbens TaxID=240449 RepID=A0ABC8WU69_9POAL
MRSWRWFSFFRAASARRHDDEEDGVALVPPPTSPATARLAEDDDYAGPAAVERSRPRHTTELQPQPTSSAANKPRTMLVVPTWGAVVLFLLGGLALLALVGTATGSWIKLDDPDPFLLGSGLGGGHGRRPHRARSSGKHIPFTCNNDTSPTCRRTDAASSPSSAVEPPSSAVPPPASCPDYFRYIHSDLSPWKETGITRDAVERGRDLAHFRLVVLGGRAYVETLRRPFQTRDVITQWGILQLLARYPGRIPDLDLMFQCGDTPVVRAADFPRRSDAPPLFRYCKDADGATLDVLFPDWSFWGWPEVNIRPWSPFLVAAARESRRLPWPARQPYAFWKGNADVSPARADLLRCNSTTGGGVDWNARLFRQDWAAAERDGFNGSDPAGQCAYRYKVYVDGRAWSVSLKYILACDSPALLVDTRFRDFFSRGLVAGRHYWPVDAARKCAAIRLAVDWGNAHPARAARMGRDGSGFAREELAMENVYDYMLHVLTEYARLLRYKPTVPENAVELCSESVACTAGGRAREFMMESRERYVADYEPCTLPPPFTAEEVREMARRDDDVRSEIRKMEKQSN